MGRFGGLAVVLLALALWFWRPASRPPAAPARSERPPPAAPVAAGPSPAGDSASDVLRPASVADAAAAAAPPARSATGSTESEMRTPPPNPLRQRLYALWSSQAPDEAWTQEAKQTLHQSALAVGVELDYPQPVDCRQSICRVIFQVDGPAQLARLAQLSLHKAAALFPVPDGRHIRYELYAAKEGSELAQRFERSSKAPPAAFADAVRGQ